MSQPGNRPVRRVIVSAVAGVFAGALLGSAPAQAADDLAITSVTVGSPAKGTGVIKAQVNVVAPAGARVTYSVGKPAWGTASINTRGVLTYTPTEQARHRAAKDGATAAARTDTVRVTVTGATGQRASTEVRLKILRSNQAPVISEVVVGQPDPSTGVVQGRIQATDPDGDRLTFTVTSDTSSVSSAKRSMAIHGLRLRSLQTANGSDPIIVCPSSQGSLSMDAATGAFTYTPTAGARTPTATSSEAFNPREAVGSAASRQDLFTVTVNDGYGGTTSVPVSVPTGSYGGGIQAPAALIQPATQDLTRPQPW